MSPTELNATVKRWTRQSILRWLLLTVISVGIGLAASSFITAAMSPPVYKRNATHLVQFGPFLGIDVVRTRTSWCDLHPGRVLFTYAHVGGARVPVIWPTVTNNFLWPQLGRARFIVLVPIPAGMPDATWSVQSTFTDSCHWWNIILGPRLEPTTPAAFRIENHQLAGLPVVIPDP